MSHLESTSLTFAQLQNIICRHKLNFLYTILLCINQFAYGIQLSIFGSTLVDLSYIYNVSIDQVSYLVLTANIGYVFGSFTGFLYNWFNRQLLISFAGLLLALTLSLLPYYDNFTMALLALILLGFGEATFESASAMWIVDMWPVGYPFFLQASQLTQSLGQIVAPILVAPFVHGKIDATNETNVTVAQRIADLTLPFGITAVLLAIGSISYLTLFMFARYDNRSRYLPHTEMNEKKIDDKDEKSANVLVQFRNVKLLLCILGTSLFAQTEVAYFEFSPTIFQQLDIKLSARKSSFVIFVLYLTVSIGRFVSSFVSLWISQEIIICYHYVIIFVGLGVIYIGQFSLNWIIIGTAILGYGFSAMYSSMLSFVHQHLNLTDRVNSIITLANGCFAVTVPLSLSQSLESTPLILFYICFAFSVSSVLLMGSVWTWITHDKRVVHCRRNSSKFYL